MIQYLYMNIAKNVDTILSKIEAARIRVSEHHIVKIVAVSKYVYADDVRLLYHNGQRAFGENKVQDFINKQEALKELPLEWHFMGRLQSNKINALLQYKPFLMHSLSSLDLAKALHQRLERDGKSLSCLVQINSAGEEQKAGFRPQEAVDGYQQIKETYPHIRLKGVMCIGAFSDDKKLVQQSFEHTHAIYEQLKPLGASICSMGMSGDYELAIACGSNMVRIGSAFFNS